MAEESGNRGDEFEEKMLKSSRRKIKFFFYLKTIGVIGAISALASLQTLQTSMNIEGAEGAIALTASYIIGNGISYAILYASKSKSENETEVTTHIPTENGTEIPSNPYQSCGVNDCQDPNVVDSSIDQYVPPAKYSVYILISVTCFMALCSILIHSFIYPGIGQFSRKLERIEKKVMGQTTDTNENNCNSIGKVFDRQLTYVNQAYSIKGNEITPKNHEKDEGVTKNESMENHENSRNTTHENAPENSRGERQASGVSKETECVKDTLKATAIFFVKTRAMMLNVSVLHYGMALGFVTADMTRAFASCVAGVEMTGLFAVCFGLSAMISALSYGKLIFPRRRHVLYAACTILEFLLYVWCFVWVPDPDDLWVVFLLFAGFGIVCGIFRQNIIATFILHFMAEGNVALSVYNVFFMAGVGLQYGLSTFMCVRDKIYMQVAVMIAGAVLFVAAEFDRSKEIKRQKSENCSVEVTTIF